MLPTSYISKSDYKVARDCHTKLYYKKLKYPSLKEADPYLKMLAEGGHMVGKMAQLLYPEGIEVTSNDPVAETKELLKQKNIVLFEPALFVNFKLVRIDILVKRGNHLQLIEVKAKSYDGSEGKNCFWNKRPVGIAQAWQAYLEDVAFQKMVLSEAYPEALIDSFLLMPDKSKYTQIDGLSGMFQIEQPDTNSKKYRIDFFGDAEALVRDELLTLININDEVDYLTPEVKHWSASYVNCIKDGLKRVQIPINKQCKDCEYRASEADSRDGFKECWGELADIKPHIFDLHSVGSIKDEEQKPYVNFLISQGKVGLFDMPFERLLKKDGSLGSIGIRQKLQLEKTQKSEEWLSKHYPKITRRFQYPLHFIDFETLSLAVPPHRNLRPYEKVAFQWSCHTLEEPGSEPKHFEWLNLDDLFPNFGFAEALMRCVGYEGTILTWSPFENSILSDIWHQANRLGYQNLELFEWLEQTVDIKDIESNGRLVDLNRICFKHYFHPEMKGRTSIKYVLPAIWRNHRYLHEISWLKHYFREDSGEVLNPYSVLEEIEIAGQAEKVAEGTGAMRAYQEMVYGLNKNNVQVKGQWSHLLREYCKLDTLAMVIIWTHWERLAGRGL